MPATDPIVPDHIRAAIHAGHIGQVTIYCDRCGTEATADYTGETREIRFAAARAHLAAAGWTITEQDLCPKCDLPEQPDGIDEYSSDLPDPRRAAERVRAYITEFGDGLYDVTGGAPLYGRDLEALCRAVLAQAPADTTPTGPHHDEPFDRPVVDVHLPA